MSNFTRQQVQEVLIKENLQPGQTLQQQKMIARQQPSQQPILRQPTRRPRQPKETPRHEIGLSHTPTSQPQIYSIVDKDLDVKMEQQNDDIEAQYAFKKEQEEERTKRYSTTI